MLHEPNLTHPGIRPGTPVLLLERRSNTQTLVHRGLIVSLSMDQVLCAPSGEPSARVAFIANAERAPQVLMPGKIVHLTHADWLEGRAGLAYEELPYPLSGVCRFCGCTGRRPCAGGCEWLDAMRTVCSAEACIERLDALAAEMERNEEAAAPLVQVFDEGDLRRELNP